MGRPYYIHQCSPSQLVIFNVYLDWLDFSANRKLGLIRRFQEKAMRTEVKVHDLSLNFTVIKKQILAT